MGKILPAGTEVKNVEIVKRPKRSRIRTGSAYPYITFESVKTGRKYKVRYQKRYHPHKSVRDYVDVMFTDKTVTELTGEMSKREVSAIQQGVLIKGMSKKAVIVAVGIPSDHRTPYLENKEWYYWTTRRKSKKICFNLKDITVVCGDLKEQSELIELEDLKEKEELEELRELKKLKEKEELEELRELKKLKEKEELEELREFKKLKEQEELEELRELKKLKEQEDIEKDLL
jgi:hypothetical protein